MKFSRFKERKKFELQWLASPIGILGVDTFLYNLSNKLKRKVKGWILIWPHQDGFSFSENDFHHMGDLQIHKDNK